MSILIFRIYHVVLINTTPLAPLEPYIAVAERHLQDRKVLNILNIDFIHATFESIYQNISTGSSPKHRESEF